MIEESMKETHSQDTLLGGRVSIRQPLEGYRVAIDPVLLAASIEAEPGNYVLDVGAGVGGASLCLAARLPSCRIVGLEVQRDYFRLAVENIDLNQARDRVEMVFGDLTNPPPRLAAGTFHHVMANPPYLDVTKGHLAPDSGKRAATTEQNSSLEQWARYCLLMARPKGMITFIHKPERLAEILSYFSGKVGNIVVFPLWPNSGKPAKRIIIRGQKNANGPLRIAPGLVLHQENGHFTPEAENILRHGASLRLIS